MPLHLCSIIFSLLALKVGLEQYGIDVLTVCPAFVQTQMTKGVTGVPMVSGLQSSSNLSRASKSCAVREIRPFPESLNSSSGVVGVT